MSETKPRNLTVELRPRRLSEMVGQDQLVQDIRNKFSGGSVPIVVLLTADFGMGKTTIANILALSFNCTHSDVFGEPCDACLENEDLLNVIEHDCAMFTKKEELEEFLPVLSSYPNYGKYRIVILDEMQQMSDKAQQLLLKTLEQDSVNIFIIPTTEPDKINAGIRGRCVPFAIPQMTNEGIRALVDSTMRLAQERFSIQPRDPEPLIKALISADIRGSRNVVMATDMYLSGQRAEQAIVIKEAGELNFDALYNAVSWGRWDEARSLIASAKPADAAMIKMRLSANFRFKLLQTKPGPRADKLAAFIQELGEAKAVESGLEFSLVVSALYRICKVVADASANQPVAALSRNAA